MILLDENLPRACIRQLSARRLRARQIGTEISYEGIKDEQIIPLLHRLHRATLFTRDQRLYRRDLAHRTYCVVCLDIAEEEAAAYIVNLLRHRDLNTLQKRLGKIIHVTKS